MIEMMAKAIGAELFGLCEPKSPTGRAVRDTSGVTASYSRANR